MTQCVRLSRSCRSPRRLWQASVLSVAIQAAQAAFGFPSVHIARCEDGCAAIERKLAYWEHLAERARVLRQRGLSLRRVTDLLLGPRDRMAFFTGGHFSKLNLIRSLLEEG